MELLLLALITMTVAGCVAGHRGRFIPAVKPIRFRR